MKLFLFSFSIYLLSCLSPGEQQQAKDIVIINTATPVESDSFRKDTFIQMASKELNIENIDESLVDLKSEAEEGNVVEVDSELEKEVIVDSEAIFEDEVTVETETEVEIEKTIPIDPELSTDSVHNTAVTNHVSVLEKEITETSVDVNNQNPEAKEMNNSPEVEKLSTNDIWNELLNNYVNDAGTVNYKGFKSQEGKLHDYLAYLSDNTPDASWSANKELAYWINAYNAFTIKLILDNYPVASIIDLHNGKPWDRQWINLGSKTYSLNNIEHDIIRPKFKDPRIHFAVNCAAISCPPVWNNAWTEDNIQANLDQVTKTFISSSANKIEEKDVQLSQIFEWYAEDFGDVIAYLNKYSDIKVASNAKLSYIKYDWALNGK